MAGAIASDMTSALIDLSKDTSVGLSYRSTIHMDIDGNVPLELPNQGLSSLFPYTGARTSVDLPPQANARIFSKQRYTFIFELAPRLEVWLTFKELNVLLDHPIVSSTTSIAPKDWHNTWVGLVSLKYQLNDKVALFGGYQYSKNLVSNL